MPWPVGAVCFIYTVQVSNLSVAILLREEDLEFARLMVQSLNLILLTATELHDMRNDLKALASPNATDFFASLYKFGAF